MDSENITPDVPAEGNPTPNTPGNPDNTPQAGSTILGSAGLENGNNSEGKEQENGNNSDLSTQYDFSALVPDGMEYDAKAAAEFSTIARECGLNQEQAGKIAQYGMQFMQSGVNAAMEQIAATHAQWGEDTRKALGADFEKTTARAAVGINKLSQTIPGLRAALNETGAGNRIEFVSLMAAIGDLLGEDNGHGVPGYGGEKSLYPNTNFGQYR